jgi:hypothetical protein
LTTKKSTITAIKNGAKSLDKYYFDVLASSLSPNSASQEQYSFSSNSATPFIYLNVNGANNLLYQEWSETTHLSTLINHGGAAVYFRDSSNLHFSITVDTSFAITVIVSMSLELYIDIFPPFAYYGVGPTLI